MTKKRVVAFNGAPTPAFDRGLAGLNTALATNYDRLAPAQRIVIDRLVEDKRYAAVASLPEIARDLSVSQSTVTRAAQMLGFKGFPDFQSRMREHFAGTVTDRLDVMAAELGDTLTGAVMEVILADVASVRAAAEDFDLGAIGEAVDALIGAHRVYVFGVGGSHGLAQIMGVGLRLAIADVRVVGGSGNGLADELLGMEPSDVLVGINFRRLDVVTVKAIEWAGRIGATAIAITDAPSSRMARSASTVLAIPPSRLRMAPSYAAAACLINGLVTAIGLATREKSRGRQQRWEYLRHYFHEIYADGTATGGPSKSRKADGQGTEEK